VEVGMANKREGGVNIGDHGVLGGVTNRPLLNLRNVGRRKWRRQKVNLKVSLRGHGRSMGSGGFGQLGEHQSSSNQRKLSYSEE